MTLGSQEGEVGSGQVPVVENPRLHRETLPLPLYGTERQG